MCALVTGVQTCALPILLEGVFGVRENSATVAKRLWEADCLYFRDVTAAIEAQGRDGARRLVVCHGLYGFFAEIGRASGRERVCQYVEISVVAVSLKKKNYQLYIINYYSSTL